MLFVIACSFLQPGYQETEKQIQAIVRYLKSDDPAVWEKSIKTAELQLSILEKTNAPAEVRKPLVDELETYKAKIKELKVLRKLQAERVARAIMNAVPLFP
jgi:hypothetical protein